MQNEYVLTGVERRPQTYGVGSKRVKTEERLTIFCLQKMFHVSLMGFFCVYPIICAWEQGRTVLFKMCVTLEPQSTLKWNYNWRPTKLCPPTEETHVSYNKSRRQISLCLTLSLDLNFYTALLLSNSDRLCVIFKIKFIHWQKKKKKRSSAFHLSTYISLNVPLPPCAC